MTERREIKSQRFDFSVPDLFMLNSTHKLKSGDKFRHEKAGADLFTVYYPHIKRWAFEPPIKSKRADRGAQFENGLTVYFEVDRITEGAQILREKIDNYIRYGSETNERFHVIFAFVGSRERVRKRGYEVIPYLEQIRRGNQFLIVNHENLVNDPFGEVIFSPKGEILSLNRML